MIDVKERVMMLKLSGNRGLYARDERGVLILFAFQQGKTIFEVNELLYSHGQTSLGAAQE